MRTFHVSYLPFLPRCQLSLNNLVIDMRSDMHGSFKDNVNLQECIEILFVNELFLLRRILDFCVCYRSWFIIIFFSFSQLPYFSFFEVIGIIKRKALIKDLAAVYHAECLAYCQELLELQKKWEEVRNNAFLFQLCIYMLQYFDSLLGIMFHNLDLIMYSHQRKKFLI
jgi:hypothetical protein